MGFQWVLQGKQGNTCSLRRVNWLNGERGREKDRREGDGEKREGWSGRGGNERIKGTERGCCRDSFLPKFSTQKYRRTRSTVEAAYLRPEEG